MAPRPPNYSQDRLQRERAQAAKVKEKADRRAFACIGSIEAEIVLLIGHLQRKHLHD